MTSDKEKLMQDIKTVVVDAEELLRDAAGKTSKEAAAMHAALTERLSVAKDKLIAAEEAAVEKAKRAAKATDVYVHENPWQSAVIAGGVGFLIGYLVSSRQHH